MSTFLRRAVATVLVAGGLLLASVGTLTSADDHTVPGALTLALTGGAALLLRRRSRPRLATPVERVIRPAERVVPSAPTPRTAPHCVIPAPRASPEAAPPAGGAPLGTPAQWRTARPGGARSGLRHCVMPRGELPHQRRASDGS